MGSLVLYAQVLEVATRQLVVGNNLNLALALLLDNDIVAEVVGAALDLDGVLEELFEGRNVKDLVAGRLLSVDNELLCAEPQMSVRHVLHPHHDQMNITGCDEVLLTFLVCFWALPDFFCKRESACCTIPLFLLSLLFFSLLFSPLALPFFPLLFSPFSIRLYSQRHRHLFVLRKKKKARSPAKESR